jgi:hypothetical protein
MSTTGIRNAPRSERWIDGWQRAWTALALVCAADLGEAGRTPGSPGSTADELGAALDALSSPEVEARDAAERWLGAHLSAEDFPQLVQVLENGDAEVRMRLARAIGTDERHLSLALLLAAEKDSGLRAVGQEALHACVARSGGRSGESGTRGEPLRRALRELARDTPPRLLRVDPSLPLGELCAGLELVAEIPLGLTVDARVAARASRKPGGELVGSWDDVLLRLARAAGVAVEAHGIGGSAAPAHGRPEDSSRQPGFLRFYPEVDPAHPTGIEVVVSWLLQLASAGEPELRALSARNLAASGLPAALHWMGELQGRPEGEIALEGLLAAAARERVTPELLQPGTLARLLAQLDADLARDRSRAGRFLAGLGRAGCLDGSGAPVAAVLLAGFDGLSHRSRWARLALLERQACPDDAALARVKEVLAAASAPAALRAQALRTFVVLAPAGDAAPALNDPAALLATPRDVQAALELGSSLFQAGIEPPARDPGELPAGLPPLGHAAHLASWLWREQAAAGAALLALLAEERGGLQARGQLAEDVLADWIRRGEAQRVLDVLATARQRNPAKALELDRLSLLLGLLPASEVGAFLDAIAEGPLGPRPDLPVLAALGCRREPAAAAASARGSLLGLLARALEERQDAAAGQPLLSALERCAQGLYSWDLGRAAGEPDLADGFAEEVQRLVRRNPNAALAAAFDRRTWPRPAGVPVLDLRRALDELLPPPGL